MHTPTTPKTMSRCPVRLTGPVLTVGAESIANEPDGEGCMYTILDSIVHCLVPIASQSNAEEGSRRKRRSPASNTHFTNKHVTLIPTVCRNRIRALCFFLMHVSSWILEELRGVTCVYRKKKKERKREDSLWKCGHRYVRQNETGRMAGRGQYTAMQYHNMGLCSLHQYTSAKTNLAVGTQRIDLYTTSELYSMHARNCLDSSWQQ